MKYIELRSKFAAAPVLRLRDLSFPGKAESHEAVQFSRWVKQGLLTRLKKGLYALPDGEAAHPLWLANQLYFPSYVSLEYVLSQAGIIPEAVGRVTSVTTRKTKNFSNRYGTFSYQKVSPAYFYGFKTFRDAEQPFYMAFVEKAILDFIYLSIPGFQKINEALFIHNYRFQRLEQLDFKRLQRFLNRFTHPRVQEGGAVLLKLLQKHS